MVQFIEKRAVPALAILACTLVLTAGFLISAPELVAEIGIPESVLWSLVVGGIVCGAFAVIIWVFARDYVDNAPWCD